MIDLPCSRISLWQCLNELNSNTFTVVTENHSGPTATVAVQA